ncbi:Coiled-coil domain-containing protein 65 [Collichthys lucidus]|uniref:Dynein regulatory complex subunit 2 n=1 Tax=Collichthys lucidus TaxID=240159 RepID=A0A4U5VDQ9_COLLU|nr:Coiled-coil domain-containing protein 65 [Collichthys lucidus]
MPKKARKGGGGKGGGKTEEERLLYLQQRAQAEEEMAKKKEEILTLFLKDKLQREERNTALNLLKLNDGWRAIFRQTRAAELRQDITVLSQTFERHLDSLDSIIKNLERDLLDAERQSAQVRRVHLQHLERLWAQQDKRLMFLQQQWEDCMQHISFRFDSDRKQMLTNTQQKQAHSEDATFTLEQQHKKVMEEIHRLYSESIASYESALIERKRAVMSDEEKLKEKMIQNQEAMQLCSQETKKLEEMMLRNQKLIQRTNEDMKKMQQLQDSVIELRQMLNYNKTENQSAEQDLIAARDLVNQETRKLREQLAQTQTASRKQLTNLSIQSDNAAKKLRAVIAKGEKVLRVTEMCQKLESKQQSVSATWFSTKKDRHERTGLETEEPAKEGSEIPELQQVMRSINDAMLRREALKKHKGDLIRENQQLRLLLRQRLDGMTVSDDAFDEPHTLLAVYQAPYATNPPDTNRRHTVIEAVHTVKHYL